MRFLNKDRWSYKTGVLRQTYAKRILHLRNVYININVDIKFSAHQRSKSKDWKAKYVFLISLSESNSNVCSDSSTIVALSLNTTCGYQ